MTGRQFIGEKLWNGASLFHGIVYARYARFATPSFRNISSRTGMW